MTSGKSIWPSTGSAHFQHFINKALQDTFRYLDVIPWFKYDHASKTLGKVLYKLREVGLKLEKTKCYFFKSHLQYLGPFLSADDIFLHLKNYIALNPADTSHTKKTLAVLTVDDS